MKIKINRVRAGSMGDQRNYGLVTGSVWNYELKPDTNRVSDTLSPVPRDEANIEAERGETIVGDLNNDGMVEHAIVGGKRHFQGGTPLNVPDGSFVFSDYNKLKIKNKDLLKGIFNYGGSKGATPAQVAKRYELNKYVDILNDPESDPLDKKTAQLMLDNNMKKLGQLALVQEGMKGFPDGIPDIAAPLFNSQQAMKRGGLVKAQGGKEYKSPYAHADHPAANNPLNYYEDIIYQQDPFMRAFETVTNTMSNPVSALTYAIDPRARNQSYLSYLKDSPHNLDAPLTYNPYLPFMGPAMVGDLTNSFMQLAPYLPPYQTAGQVEEEEEMGMMDYLKNAGIYTASQFAPLYALYRGAKALAPKVAPYLGQLWEKEIPEVRGRKPVLNPNTGLPYKTGPKAGKYTRGVIQPAKTVGIKPTATKALQALKSAKGKGTLAALIALYGANVAYQMMQDQENRNRIPEKPAAQEDENTGQARIDSVGALNYAKRKAREAAEEKAPANTTKADNVPVVNDDNVGPIINRGQPRATAGDRNRSNAVTDTAKFLEDAGIRKQGGSILPKAQAGSQVGEGYYKIQDPAWANLSEDFEEIRPGYYPGWKSVGSQLPSQNPKYYTRGSSMEIIPRIGIKNPTTNVAYTGLQDFIDYANPYVNFEGYDTKTNDPAKGIAQWKADMSSTDPNKRKKAGEWLAIRANAYNQSVTGNKDLLTIDPNQKGYWELGAKNLNIPFLRRKAKQAAATNTPQTQLSGQGATQPNVNFQGSNRPMSVGYSPEDIMGITAALNQQIPDYMLTRSAYNPTLISPAYLDPDYSPDLAAYKIAAEQAGSGPAARGSLTGMAGKLFENLNRVRQANKATNLDTYFKTSMANQQELAKANLYEAEENKDYINRLNTLINSNTLDQNTKQALIVKTLADAETNRRKLNNLNAMLPYQYSDWEGTSVNSTLRSIYDTPTLGYGLGSSNNFETIYSSIYKKMIDAGADAKDAAIEAAKAAARFISSKNQGFGTAGSAASIYDLMDED